ncbi:MAG: DHHW family protein [Oscillospiraceae bacterium]|nr:DHHW family protein [Oscillospiraceae bacterium]
MKTNKISAIIVAVFLLQIYIQGMLFIFFDKQTFSQSENRMLANFPAISVENYLSGNFSGQFESYVNDHFPFRSQYISISRQISSLYYFEGFAQEDDILFLAGANPGKNESNEDADPIAEPPQNAASEEDDYEPQVENGLLIMKDRLAEAYSISLRNINEYANAANKLYEECGKPETYVILPPCAAQLYLPDKYRSEQNNQYIAFDLLREKLDGPQYVDLERSYEKHKDEYIYFNTDHHWTALGAYYAYEALAEAMGAKPTRLGEYAETGSIGGFQGSLHRALAAYPQYESLKDASDTIEYYVPKNRAEVTAYMSAEMTGGEQRKLFCPERSPEGAASYDIFMGGDIVLGHIRSEIGNGRSIAVVRDSYGHAFLPFLVDNFEHIYSIEPRYFNKTTNTLALGDFFRDKNIDVLLFVSYSLTATGSHWLTWGHELLKLTKD